MSPTVFRERGYRFFFFPAKKIACTFMSIAPTEKLNTGWNPLLSWQKTTGFHRRN